MAEPEEREERQTVARMRRAWDALVAAERGDIDLTPQAYTSLVNFLGSSLENQALRRRFEEETGLDTSGVLQQASTPQVDQIEQILSGIGGLGPSNISRNVEITSRGETEVTTERGELARRRVYVDLPTADQFLAQWENAFAGFLSEQRAAGKLSGADVVAALNSADLFYDEYLQEMAAKAQRGEPLYRVVGAEGEPVRVGERVGEVSRQDVVGKTAEKARQEQQTIAAETATPVGAGAGAGAVTTQEAESLRRIAEETAATRGTQATYEVEDIYQRPELARVPTLMPGDFLRERYGESLATVVRSRKGEQARARMTELGAPVSTPRRIG